MAGQLFDTKKEALAYKKKRSKAWKKNKKLESTVQDGEKLWRFVSKDKEPAQSETDKIDAQIERTTRDITKGLDPEFSKKVEEQQKHDIGYAADTMKLIVEGEDPYLGEDWHNPEEASAMRGEFDSSDDLTIPQFKNFKSGGSVKKRKKKHQGKQYANGGSVRKPRYKG